jgi:4-amino-4-deoxy-L-arabinose transferase-like glycosyltransferase
MSGGIVERKTMDEKSHARVLRERPWLTTEAVTAVLAGVVAVRLILLPAYPILDKSEARYAYIGELMTLTGNWITPFIDHDVPFWGKPPLSMWASSLSYLVFGFNAFAARLPSFLIFALVAWLIVQAGMRERDRDFGLLAACVFASTALGFFLGGTVMTDPALLLGVCVTMTAFWRCMERPRRDWGYLFFVGLAIGLLAKGPIGVVLPGLSIGAWVAWQNKWRALFANLPWISGTLLLVALVLPWYALAEYRTPGFLKYFIVGEHFERFLTPHWQGDLYGSGRERPIGTIWLFGVIAGLPWSAIFIAAVLSRRLRGAFLSREMFEDPWLSYLLAWLLAPFVLFTFARNILISYVATGLPAFGLLTAHALTRMRLDWRLIMTATLLLPIGLLVGAVAAHILPGSPYLVSQANIVGTYEQRRGVGYQLVYLWDKPYSADFYSKGRATLAAGVPEIERVLSAGGDPYIAVADKNLVRLPGSLYRRLEEVAVENGTRLFRPIPTNP